MQVHSRRACWVMARGQRQKIRHCPSVLYRQSHGRSMLKRPASPSSGTTCFLMMITSLNLMKSSNNTNCPVGERCTFALKIAAIRRQCGRRRLSGIGICSHAGYHHSQPMPSFSRVCLRASRLCRRRSKYRHSDSPPQGIPPKMLRLSSACRRLRPVEEAAAV